MDNKLLRGDELDQLLAMASNPVPAAGFEQRIIARLPRRQAKPWLVGLPLAASLAVGLWLGSANVGNGYFATNSNTVISDNTDDASDTGFDDVAEFIEGSST